MVMIECSNKCLHEKDGYCSLNHITNLTGNINSSCGYFEAKNIQKKGSDYLKTLKASDMFFTGSI